MASPTDEWFLPLENDSEDLVRPYWHVSKCPMDSCSSNSWRKVTKYSFESPEVLTRYVMGHLTQKPGRHELGRVRAADICRQHLVIYKKEQKFKDRERYRKELNKRRLAESSTSKAASAARAQGKRALPDKASASQSIPPGPPRMCPPYPLPAAAATGIRTCISDGPSQPIPAVGVQPIMEPTCPGPAAPTTNTMSACISDESRKRGRDGDNMTNVPTHRFRTLSESLRRLEESAHETAIHCVQVGSHFQTEAQVLRAARVEIDRLLEDTS